MKDKTLNIYSAEQNGDVILSGYPDVLTPEQVKEILKTGKNTVYSMLKNGEIKSLMIGGKYRVPKLYVKEFLYGIEDTKECNLREER